MISCTEFIPAYSTMFTYLEEKYGPQEVPAYWEALFVAEEFPLYKIIAKEGLVIVQTAHAGTQRHIILNFLRTFGSQAQDLSVLHMRADHTSAAAVVDARGGDDLYFAGTIHKPPRLC